MGFAPEGEGAGRRSRGGAGADIPFKAFALCAGKPAFVPSLFPSATPHRQHPGGGGGREKIRGSGNHKNPTEAPWAAELEPMLPSVQEAGGP